MTAPAPKTKGRPRNPALAARIVQGTIELIAERGPYGFSVDDVAARVGAGKGTIYRRWPSFGALSAEVTRGLGVRESDIAWTVPGSVREDLITLLTAATTGTRARAELALLSCLPHRPDLREAWAAGPLLRLAQAVTVQRNRAHQRGDAHDLPSIVRTQAASAWLRVDAAQHGTDPDADTIAGIVDVLLLPPPPATPGQRPARDDDYTPEAVDADAGYDPSLPCGFEGPDAGPDQPDGDPEPSLLDADPGELAPDVREQVERFRADITEQGGGTLAVAASGDGYVAGYVFGQESPDSPMAAGAAYGMGATEAQALAAAAENAGLPPWRDNGWGSAHHQHVVDQLTAAPLTAETLRALAKDAITRRLTYWQANTIRVVIADDDGGLAVELNSGGNCLAVEHALAMGGIAHEVDGWRVSIAPPAEEAR